MPRAMRSNFVFGKLDYNISNNQRLQSIRQDVLALIRERYADFGPTLPAEKMRELHRFFVSKETLRQWMKADGLWLTRKQRIPQPHQPRFRRECFGRDRREQAPGRRPGGDPGFAGEAGL